MRAQRGSMGIKLRSMIEHSEVGVKTVINCDNCAIKAVKCKDLFLRYAPIDIASISLNFTKHPLIRIR